MPDRQLLPKETIMKGTSCKAALVLLLLAVLSAPGFAATKYDITDLGTGVIPSAINQNGDVVGTIVSNDAGPQAFIYRAGIVVGLGQMGGTASWGLGINDSAVIVGSVCMDELCKQNPYWGLQRHGFLAKEGQITDLMSAAGMLEGARINNSGQVLGRQYIDGYQQKIVLYDSANALLTDISQGHGQNTSLTPRGLNNLGDAVFIESFCGSYECSNSLLYSGGTLQLLPKDMYLAWDVADINDLGKIVGTSGPYLRGVLYYKELTFIPHANLLAFAPDAINNEGVMLGRARDARALPTVFTKRPIWLSHKPAPDLYSNPAVYEKSKLTILQERLTKTADQWILEEAFDINDKGQIVGYGRKNNEEEHGFLLTPASIKKDKQ